MHIAVQLLFQYGRVMKYISDEQANALLENLGMKLGAWHEISFRDGGKEEHLSVCYRAPSNSLELLAFSQHAASWLPAGVWKMLVTDNSNALARDTETLIEILASAHRQSESSGAYNILFSYSGELVKNYRVDISIAAIIHALLLSEGHAYIASSSSTNGRFISIQDGYLYFHAYRADIAEAEQLILDFEANPLSTPSWAL